MTESLITDTFAVKPYTQVKDTRPTSVKDDPEISQGAMLFDPVRLMRAKWVIEHNLQDCEM